MFIYAMSRAAAGFAFVTIIVAIYLGSQHLALVGIMACFGAIILAYIDYRETKQKNDNHVQWPVETFHEDWVSHWESEAQYLKSFDNKADDYINAGRNKS